ncbi:MAG: hypothetical protein Q7R92_04505 [bacterium]|nr:hypothetical protein [bacterium]
MNSNQASSLFRYGFYQFNEVTFKNGRVSPYTVRLPKLPQKFMFRDMAISTWNIRQISLFQSVHFIGIANKGVPLAEAIYEYGLKLGKDTLLSIIYPRKMESSPKFAGDKTKITILVDNAVTTGETIAKVLDIIRPFGYKPTLVIRIFDREDVGEDGLSTLERIKKNNGLELISIFKLRDIISCLCTIELQAILTYQSLYGTASFREWIGGKKCSLKLI